MPEGSAQYYPHSAGFGQPRRLFRCHADRPQRRQLHERGVR